MSIVSVGHFQPDPSTLAHNPSGTPPVDTDDGVSVIPGLTEPKRVCIVALGGSSGDFVRQAMSTQLMAKPYDEVWTLNRGFKGFPHDKLFALDDLRWLAKKDKAYGKMLMAHTKPIVTSTVYPEFPTAVAYPFEEVRQKLNDDIFAVNTVAYMVGYALLKGVKELSIFGADFFYPNGSTAESGGQAVAYLLGLGKFFGMEFKIPGSSTLLYANTFTQMPGGTVGRPPYGFHRRKELTPEERGLPQPYDRMLGIKE